MLRDSQNKIDKILYYLAIAIIFVGIALRIIVWLQNRDLIIDECNIARNLYEKGFAELSHALDYEQYAPPLFMWMLKLSAMAFGFSEQSLRLFPLLTGIAALFVFLAVLRQFMSFRSLWYPLILFATGHWFLRYSTELKQYMPDILITLSLTLLAIKTDIVHRKPLSFVMIWLVVGSIAVWSSMPAIFTLVAVGIYYLCVVIRGKQFKKIGLLVIPGLLWLAQFAFYFFTVLKDQVNSDYLQDFHMPFFLFGTPDDKGQWMHDWQVTTDILKHATGYGHYVFMFNFTLLLIGVGALIFKRNIKGLLVLVPIGIAFTLAVFNKFSLIPRVVLFLMPLMQLLVGYGLHVLLSAWPGKRASAAGPASILKAVYIVSILALPVWAVRSHNALGMITHPFVSEQATWGLQFLKDNKLPGDRLFVHNGGRPSYIYYTQMHPGKGQWKQLEGAKLLMWRPDYNGLCDSIAKNMTGNVGFYYTSIYPAELHQRKDDMDRHLQRVAIQEKWEGMSYTYIYKPGATADTTAAK